MKQALLVGGSIVALAVIANPANARYCQHHPGDDGAWTWRTVDGQRCWYAGRHVVPKDQLHWPTDKPVHTDPPPPKPSWLERAGTNAPPANIYFPTLVNGDMVEVYPRLIWPQPWLSPDTVMHWPLLIDVDRVPFTAWNKRIGE